jgi:bacillithiol biosynthesis cysteine-adding enzyme BshC
MYINYSDIPSHQNLFLDYLYEFENVRRFYKNNFRDKDEYIKKIKIVSEDNTKFRREITEILHQQYKLFTPSDKTINNIDALRGKKTLAVVTGQQLGMLSGPMYTLYKIISAIKLCHYLSERYDDYNFVPVFWLESDDHDFDEVREIKILDQNNGIKSICYDDGENIEENRGSVGSIKFKETINQLFLQLTDMLRDTEFKQPLLEKLSSIYSCGKTFKESFAKLLFELFDRYGLILFDPQDARVKQLLKPIFIKEINDFRIHTEKIVHVSATLEELYHAQVKVRPVNLFYSYDEGRFAIEPVENEFRLRRKRKKFSKEELLALINDTPEAFSPNVLLRPICQDFLFPTAFYVGGPSEIAYFAQVMPLYPLFNVESPILYPRSSATIIEKNIDAIIDKYDLTLLDIFIDIENLKSKVINSSASNSVDNIFKETLREIELTFDRLRERLFQIDKTMSDSAGKYETKVKNYIEELKGKVVEAQMKKYETTLRQIDKVAASVFPNGNMQERELNFIYFANKYGLGVIDSIFNQLEINIFEHQIIKL